MIDPPRSIRRQTETLSSQLALELGVTVASLVGALALVRLLLLALGVTDRIWAGATVYGLTDPIVWLLTLLPGAGRQVVGKASLADLAAVAVVVLAPLVLLARRRPR
jgi:hypothetical protein